MSGAIGAVPEPGRGGAGAGRAPEPPVPPGRRRGPALPRRRPALPGRSPLPRAAAVPRVLPRREGLRAGSQPPDRLDRAGGPPAGERPVSDDREWLETDGLGGFATGPVRGGRSRRYHALLVADAGGQRFVLVNGLEVQVQTPGGTWPLSTQSYADGVVHPDGGRFLEAFIVDPWPIWRYRLPDGTVLGHELFMRHGRAQTFLSWRLIEGGPATLRVRLLLSGRNYHSLHRENPAFRFQPEPAEERLRFRPYDGVPALVVGGNGVYRHDPIWYRNFHYVEEERRG